MCFETIATCTVLVLHYLYPHKVYVPVLVSFPKNKNIDMYICLQVPGTVLVFILELERDYKSKKIFFTCIYITIYLVTPPLLSRSISTTCVTGSRYFEWEYFVQVLA